MEDKGPEQVTNWKHNNNGKNRDEMEHPHHMWMQQMQPINAYENDAYQPDHHEPSAPRQNNYYNNYINK